jgi:hypothetical protein
VPPPLAGTGRGACSYQALPMRGLACAFLGIFLAPSSVGNSSSVSNRPAPPVQVQVQRCVQFRALVFVGLLVLVSVHHTCTPLSKYFSPCFCLLRFAPFPSSSFSPLSLPHQPSLLNISILSLLHISYSQHAPLDRQTDRHTTTPVHPHQQTHIRNPALVST